MIRAFCLSFVATSVMCVAGSICDKPACADNPAFWTVSEGTNGEDVFWTSPTAVDVGYPRYGTTFEITRVEVFAGFLSLDITDQLPSTTGTAVIGSLPVTLITGTFGDPNSGNSATVDIGIDPNGFGQTSITEVMLGTVEIFGIPVDITRIEVDTDISVEGVLPGDFDGDLDVDYVDLNLWETSRGVDAGADTNFDGVSDGRDFLDWQEFLGTQLVLPQVAVFAVPEPGTSTALAGLLSLAAFSVRTRRAEPGRCNS